MALNYRFLQKRSDVPKRGRLTFAIFFKFYIIYDENCHIYYDIIRTDNRRTR